MRRVYRMFLYGVFLLGGAVWFPLHAVKNHPTQEVIKRITSMPVKYPIRFVYVGDSRPGRKNPEEADSVFALIRKEINRIRPDFVIHGGDFVQSGKREEYMRFLKQFDSLDVNALTVVGNHELYAEEGPEMYDSIFGKTDYYFDYGKYRFIVLSDNHQSPKKSKRGYHYVDYYISNKQVNWLEDVLRNARDEGKYPIVFAHVPPYQSGYDTTKVLGWSRYYPKPNLEKSNTIKFTNLLNKYGVKIAFFGHDHIFDRHEYGGTTVVISGGGGSPLYKPISSPPTGTAMFHFLLVTADSTGNLRVELYPAGSENPDTTFTFWVEY